VSAPSPGMFTLPASAQRVWVATDGRVWTVAGGRVQRCVVAKWTDAGFTVTGNGMAHEVLLRRWSARPEATRLDFSGPCPTCSRPVGDLRGWVCERVRGAA
jgi:hypothetical protein